MGLGEQGGMTVEMNMMRTDISTTTKGGFFVCFWNGGIIHAFF